MPTKLDAVLGICRDQLAQVVHSGISAQELRRGKGQLGASLVMELEDSGARMMRLGKAELVPGNLLSVDDLLHSIDTVTLDDVRRVAGDVLDVEPTLAVVGPDKALSRLS